MGDSNAATRATLAWQLLLVAQVHTSSFLLPLLVLLPPHLPWPASLGVDSHPGPEFSRRLVDGVCKCHGACPRRPGRGQDQEEAAERVPRDVASSL